MTRLGASVFTTFTQEEMCTHIDLGIVRQLRKSLVQSLVHLLGCTLEETTTSANEQGVAGEDGSLVAVLEQVADAVLGMAGSVQSFDLDTRADREGLAVGRGLCDLGAVLASDHRY